MKTTQVGSLAALARGFADASLDILHHVGVVNTNLDVLSLRYEQLGFTLTPVSTPRIVLQPGGEPESLGAANRHAIFENNYLELLGIVNPDKWASIDKSKLGAYDLDRVLNRYEGLHVMHFGTNNIEAVKERFDYQSVPSSAIKLFQRNVETEDGERMMQAKTIQFPLESNPEGLLQIAQHDTPELIFQKRYMQHDNGAIALTEILIVTDTPSTYASKYELYSGHRGEEINTGHYCIDLGDSRITVVEPEHVNAIIPGCKIPVLPFMAAFTIRVASLRHLCDLLALNHIPFLRMTGAVMVYPNEACGCTIIFEE